MHKKKKVIVKQYEIHWSSELFAKAIGQKLKAKKDVVKRPRSAKVTLVVLYGLLDPQKHSREPLVQP